MDTKVIPVIIRVATCMYPLLDTVELCTVKQYKYVPLTVLMFHLRQPLFSSDPSACEIKANLKINYCHGSM